MVTRWKPSENEAATSGNVALPLSKTMTSSTMLTRVTEAKISVPQGVRWTIRWHMDTGTTCSETAGSCTLHGYVCFLITTSRMCWDLQPTVAQRQRYLHGRFSYRAIITLRF